MSWAERCRGGWFLVACGVACATCSRPPPRGEISARSAGLIALPAIPSSVLPATSIAPGPSPQRLHTMGGSADDRSRAIALDPSGDVYLATTVSDETTISRNAPDGTRRWTTPLTGVVHSYGFLMRPSPQGGVVVAADGILARLTDRGAVAWRASVEDASGLAVDGAGDVVVTTHRFDKCIAEPCPKDLLLSYRPDGALAWKREMQAPGFPYNFADVAFRPGGGLVGVGYDALVELRASGEIERAVSAQHSAVSLLRVAVSPTTGDFVVAGTLAGGTVSFGGTTLSNETAGHRAFVLAISPGGVTRWSRMLPIEVASSLAVNRAGRVIAAGGSLVPCPRAEVYAFSARGEPGTALKLPDTPCQLGLRDTAALPPYSALATDGDHTLVIGSYTGNFHIVGASARSNRQDIFWLELRL